MLFLNPTGRMGGAETALLEMLAGLRESQPTWSLELVAASEGPLIGRAQALGITVYVMPFPRPLAAVGEWGRRGGVWPRLRLAASLVRAARPARTYVRRLGRLLQERAPDIVHTNGLKMHLLGAWARPDGAALLWHLHDYVSPRPLTARLLARASRACSAIVANSESVAADLRRVFGNSLTIEPLWNAVDLLRFSPIGPRYDLDDLAALPPAGEEVVRAGLVATFARWKGHRVFLQALANVPSSAGVRGYVIGGPVYDTADSQVSPEALVAEAEALGLGGRVGFTGFVEDPAPAMRALDIVVHASTDPEPFGLVIAEAMACGKAVVASEAGGAAEIVTPGVNALTHRPGDAEGLARAIATLAADPARRRQLGAAGRSTAERSFARRRLAADLVRIYRRLAAARGEPFSLPHTGRPA
ncbi:MAG: glycosyltransferase family 4 protein [Gemmatimonadetes bacterium]|nr:glycosyltransferase family 4 protein [Gemmatimonadota bacterium]